ncbi:hypothetical protein [Kitasatospora sp. NPDC051164]|uniref:hypothetical protein n=1 Tax=Kitasatospora sp. NPDC051164 TaxID=3364055 RepID=UPI0037B41FD3
MQIRDRQVGYSRGVLPRRPAGAVPHRDHPEYVMLVPDLARLVREADRDQLAAAVQTAVDTVAWYTPASKPDYEDTDHSIARSEAKAELAAEVVDSVVLALSASVITDPAGAGRSIAHPESPSPSTEERP